MNISNRIEIENSASSSVIRFFGFIDAAVTEEARGVIAAKIPEDCRNVIVDLAKVEFLDSHGVGMFVSLLKKAHKNGGRLFFIAAEGQPAAVLNIVGFNSTLVTYCQTLQQARALAAAQKSPSNAL
ncbi:MAG: STAS domain-containing protein [Alphaproteobacteria bacterium]|nr:STAS domain-containing protein [Alphaproteobacteria bacterium]MDE2337219.1 STAS domain-containing protein [Alphaproteobacteria bacterium]